MTAPVSPTGPSSDELPFLGKALSDKQLREIQDVRSSTILIPSEDVYILSIRYLSSTEEASGTLRVTAAPPHRWGHPLADPAHSVYGTDGPYDGESKPIHDNPIEYFYRLMAHGKNPLDGLRRRAEKEVKAFVVASSVIDAYTRFVAHVSLLPDFVAVVGWEQFHFGPFMGVTNAP